MFCSNCGTQIVGDARFCGVCGTQILQENSQADVQQPVMGQVIYQTEPEVDPVRKAMADEVAGSALTWGILSLVFAYFTGFLGIIFACVGFSKARQFKYLNNGVLEGKAKVGRGLSIGGLWAGIVVVALFVLCFALGVAMGLSGEVYPDYYFDDDLYQLSLSAMNMML